MKTIRIAALAAALIAAPLSASALAQPADSPLVGRSVRAEFPDGRVTTVQFQEGGVAVLTLGDQQITGAWTMTDTQLCFDWPEQPRECWPWDGAAQPGVPVAVTSDHGDSAVVTFL